MKDQKIYNAEDFFKYHNGEMSAVEMHQLEKAALTDSFLSNALDGFANETSYDRKKLLERLNQNAIDSESKKSKVVPLIRYLSVAAGISCIIFGILKWETKESPASLAASEKKDNRKKIIVKDSSVPLLAENKKIETERPGEANNAKIIQNENKNNPAKALVNNSQNTIEASGTESVTDMSKVSPATAYAPADVTSDETVTSSAQLTTDSSNYNVVATGRANLPAVQKATNRVMAMQTNDNNVTIEDPLSILKNKIVTELINMKTGQPDTLHISYKLTPDGKPTDIQIREKLKKSIKQKVIKLIEASDIDLLKGNNQLIIPIP